MLDYRTAIHATETAIRDRAALFRAQGIAVFAFAAMTAGYALLTRRLVVFVLIMLLVPLSGTFFLFDAKVLRGWRRQLLAAWTAGAVDLVAFFIAIRALPHLPQQTLEGMLATLPNVGDLMYERRLRPATRRAIAATTEALRREESDVLLLKVIATTIVAGVAIAAAWTHRWSSAVGLLFLLLLPVAGTVLRRRNRNQREAVIQACPADADFSDADFQRVRATLR